MLGGSQNTESDGQLPPLQASYLAFLKATAARSIDKDI